MDAFLERLSDEPFRAGATFALLFILIGVGVLWFLNKKFRWWVSSDMFDAESKRAERAEAETDAAEKASDKRASDLREDWGARVAQVRADSQAEHERLLKFIDALQRDADSWKLAWHTADQANREEADARWDEIRAFMTRSVAQSAVIARFITELQRQAGMPPMRELEGSDDRGVGSDVV